MMDGNPEGLATQATRQLQRDAVFREVEVSGARLCEPAWQRHRNIAVLHPSADVALVGARHDPCLQRQVVRFGPHLLAVVGIEIDAGKALRIPSHHADHTNVEVVGVMFEVDLALEAGRVHKGLHQGVAVFGRRRITATVYDDRVLCFRDGDAGGSLVHRIGTRCATWRAFVRVNRQNCEEGKTGERKPEGNEKGLPREPWEEGSAHGDTPVGWRHWGRASRVWLAKKLYIERKASQQVAGRASVWAVLTRMLVLFLHQNCKLAS